jgi:two-component system NtrC family sensor kinase
MRTVLSLRVRLALLVAVVVAAVIAIEGYLEMGVFQRSMETDFLQASAATAQAVADDLELRSPRDGPAEIRPLLEEFIIATPTVRDIAVLMEHDGVLELLVRTSSAGAGDVLPVARQAVERREQAWVGDGRARIVAVPVVRQGKVAGAVAVSLSLAALDQMRARGRQVTLLFTIPAIVVLTLLVDLLARRLVHRPITAIRETMRRAGAGDSGARAPVERPDEIGEVAVGLNEMLARLEQFQTELQARVDEATGELRRTNARLVDSYQRVLRLREALGNAERMAALGQVAANVAHQIGTPLNLISGYVQLMIEEARADPSALHRLQTVEAQIRKVSDAVRAMLDYARRPSPQREEIDVAALIDQVVEVSRPALRAASVEIRVEARGPLPTVWADPVQLELALLNLVSNSLDAMPDGGLLTITVSATSTGVRIVVADSGTGIPADVMPRIFEPWVTTKPPGRGTGLGLSITREAIASHGGTIDVRSEPGHGAVFSIDLPVPARGPADDRSETTSEAPLGGAPVSRPARS